MSEQARAEAGERQGGSLVALRSYWDRWPGIGEHIIVDLGPCCARCCERLLARGPTRRWNWCRRVAAGRARWSLRALVLHRSAGSGVSTTQRGSLVTEDARLFCHRASLEAASFVEDRREFQACNYLQARSN